MLAPYALCTLAALKSAFGTTGAGKDTDLEIAINRASREVEAFLGRRVIFRAPTEDDDAIVADVVLADGALTLAGAPASPGRTAVVTVTDADRSLTAGTLTLTGTVAGVAGVTEAYDLTQGPVLYGVKFFSAYSGASVSGLVGNGVADKVRIGTSLGYVDYHTPDGRARRPDLLVLPDWPVRQVLTVHVDAARSYGSDTLLTEDVDYLLTGADIGRPRGALQRISGTGGGASCWHTALRAIRVVHSAGYFTRANVPAEIVAVAKRLARLYFDDEDRGNLGVQAGGNTLSGTWTRFARPGLDKEARQAIASEKNFSGYPAPERDFDLEAA